MHFSDLPGYLFLVFFFLCTVAAARRAWVKRRQAIDRYEADDEVVVPFRRK
jgi:hypothetical protein